MSAYRKGARAEREFQQYISKHHQCISIRSAGSKTPIDVICGNGAYVYAFQIKTGEREVKIDIPKLREWAKMFMAIPCIARKIPYHGWEIQWDV